MLQNPSLSFSYLDITVVYMFWMTIKCFWIELKLNWKATIYHSLSSTRSILQGYCPCTANSYYAGSKEPTLAAFGQKIEYKMLLLIIKLSMVKSLHNLRSFVSIYAEQAPKIIDKKTPQTSEMLFVSVWRTLLHVCYPIPWNSRLTSVNVPFPLMLSGAAWKVIYSMWHIPRFTYSYFVRMYCLWLLVFSTYKHFSRSVTSHYFEMGAI